MLKLKYLVENMELARFALSHWHHDEETLEDRMRWFRISSNAVYPFDRDGLLCFLRLAPTEEKDSLELLGEIDFLLFLNRHSYPAMRPIPAENNEMLLLLDTPWGKWYASAFESVPGRPLDRIPMTAELAAEYGAALGKLHFLSAQYHAPLRRRNEQDVLKWAEQVLRRHAVPAQILDNLKNTSQRLAQLPHIRTLYGLIHYDFEPDNVFWDGEKCSAIDFEDGMLHFYAADVVQALDELPTAHHAAFLNGYHMTCPEIQADPCIFPLMRRFRNLFSYARLLHCLSEKPAAEPAWMPALVTHLEKKLHELEKELC